MCLLSVHAAIYICNMHKLMHIYTYVYRVKRVCIASTSKGHMRHIACNKTDSPM